MLALRRILGTSNGAENSYSNVTPPSSPKRTVTRPRGKLLHSFGRKGHGKGYFNSPCGVTVANNGDIIIVDTENNRVQVFTSEGLLKNIISEKGSRANQLHQPIDIALSRDEDENITVTDSVNAAIKTFSQEGKFLTEYTANDIFEFPHGLCIGCSKHMIVTDISKHAVIVLTSIGTVHCTFGSYGDRVDQFDHPFFVDVNSNNEIVVCDSGNNRVKICSLDGSVVHLFTLNDFRLQDEDFVFLHGVAIDTDDNILVVGNNTIYIITRNGRLWEVINPEDGLHDPKCLAYDKKGRLVATQCGQEGDHEVSVFVYEKRNFESLKWIPDLTKRDKLRDYCNGNYNRVSNKNSPELGATPTGVTPTGESCKKHTRNASAQTDKILIHGLKKRYPSDNVNGGSEIATGDKCENCPSTKSDTGGCELTNNNVVKESYASGQRPDDHKSVKDVLNESPKKTPSSPRPTRLKLKPVNCDEGTNRKGPVSKKRAAESRPGKVTSRTSETSSPSSRQKRDTRSSGSDKRSPVVIDKSPRSLESSPRSLESSPRSADSPQKKVLSPRGKILLQENRKDVRRRVSPVSPTTRNLMAQRRRSDGSWDTKAGVLNKALSNPHTGLPPSGQRTVTRRLSVDERRVPKSPIMLRERKDKSDKVKKGKQHRSEDKTALLEESDCSLVHNTKGSKTSDRKTWKRTKSSADKKGETKTKPQMEVIS